MSARIAQFFEQERKAGAKNLADVPFVQPFFASMLDFAMISALRYAVRLLPAFATLLLATGCAHTNDSRPNVLLLVVDDLNHWIGSLHRNPQARTPNIDRLAARGVNFTHAYCPSPLCNPSRAAFMSGKRTATIGVYSNRDMPWSNYIDERQCLNGFVVDDRSNRGISRLDEWRCRLH